MNLRFLPQAEAEFLDAVYYFASIRTDLGERFRQAVLEAVQVAVAHPERGAPRSKSTRRRFVKSFSFSVIYRAGQQGVVIVAVAHQRRLPGYWSKRFK